MADNYIPEVRDQYEDYPFPAVDPEEDASRLQMMPQDMLANINHSCFGGRRVFDDGFRVLVAGGGTGHSVVFLAEQLRHTNAEVHYIDLSRASTRVARRRASIRGLENIIWHHGSLLDLPTLGLGKFDYINCTGVLHHLASPTGGLLALKAVLKDDGAMGLMVYGRYGRASYYHVQDLMRLVNEPGEAKAAKVANTKMAMSALPNKFFAQYGINRGKHLEGFFSDDVNLYDTFLHSQDRAYTVPEVYDWLDTCGLQMNGFSNFNATMVGKVQYRPELYIENEDLLERVLKFPLPQQQAIGELMAADIGLHTFYVSHRTNTAASFDDLDNVPFFTDVRLTNEAVFATVDGEAAFAWMEANPGEPYIVKHPVGLTVMIDPRPFARYFLRFVDGKRTLREIVMLTHSHIPAGIRRPSLSELLNDFRGVYDVCDVLDWMKLRHSSVPAYRTYSQMQGPVSEQHGRRFESTSAVAG